MALRTRSFWRPWLLAMLVALALIRPQQPGAAAFAAPKAEVRGAVVARGWAPACGYWDGGFAPLDPGPVTLGFSGSGFLPGDLVYLGEGRPGDQREGAALGIATVDRDGRFACTVAYDLRLPLPGHDYQIPIIALSASRQPCALVCLYATATTALTVSASLHYPEPGTVGTPAYCRPEDIAVEMVWFPGDMQRIADIRAQNRTFRDCTLTLVPTVAIIIPETLEVRLIPTHRYLPAEEQQPLGVLHAGQATTATIMEYLPPDPPPSSAPFTLEALRLTLVGTGDYTFSPPGSVFGPTISGGDLGLFALPLDQRLGPVVESLPRAGTGGYLAGPRHNQARRLRSSATLAALGLLLGAGAALLRRFGHDANALPETAAGGARRAIRPGENSHGARGSRDSHEDHCGRAVHRRW